MEISKFIVKLIGFILPFINNKLLNLFINNI